MIADDLRPDLGSYKQPALTPNLDKLAATGMLFERAYCQMSVCAPSRNSIFSGRRPDRSGVWNFIDWFRNETEGAEAWLSMPQYFKSYNYTVLGLGKTFHGCTNEGHLLSEGYCDIPLSWSNNLGAEPFTYLPYVREHCPKGTFCTISDESTIFDYTLANRTVATLRRLASSKSGSPNGLPRPWFLGVGFKKPHAPWGSPERTLDLYNASDLAVAAFPTAPVDMPDVAFIHNFGIELPTGYEIRTETRSTHMFIEFHLR